MDKLSNEQLSELYTDAAQTIRKLASRTKDLEEKLAAKEIRERAEKVASAMHGKSIRLETPREDLIGELEKEASAGRLETLEKAVDMVGPDMGKFASVDNRHDNNDQGNVSSGSALEQFILT
jgi:hypothetical protein